MATEWMGQVDEWSGEESGMAQARAIVAARDLVKPAYREADRLAREATREVSDAEEYLADVCAALMLGTTDDAAVLEAESELEAAIRKERRFRLAARSLGERLGR